MIIAWSSLYQRVSWKFKKYNLQKWDNIMCVYEWREEYKWHGKKLRAYERLADVVLRKNR